MNVATVSTATPVVARPPIDVAGLNERISIKGLNFYYGDHKALKEISLPLYKNKVTAFIGPSGCGKSTFLRCLNRMHEVLPGARVEGSITIEGQDIYGKGVDPVRVRRHIGMVFQKPNPFPMMTIYDNVIAGLKLNGIRKSKRELDETVERKKVDAFGQLLEEDDRFGFLIDNPPVLSRMKALLGNCIQLHSATARVTPAHDGSTCVASDFIGAG